MQTQFDIFRAASAAPAAFVAFIKLNFIRKLFTENDESWINFARNHSFFRETF